MTSEIDKTRPYEVKFLGWCHEPAKNHDKIWGWITLGQNADRRLYIFWGRRLGRISFKRHDLRFKGHDLWYADQELRAMTAKKMRKRPTGQYEEVDIERVSEVMPGFLNQLGSEYTLAKLFNKIRGEGERPARNSRRV